MSAANRQSVESDTRLPNDMPILRRKWQAALEPGETLPRYENVLLGSLGRLADHLVLLRCDDGAFAVSRTGRYVQNWLGDARWDIPLDALRPDCAASLTEAASNAIANNHPYLATAHCVQAGMVRTYDVLALPTLSRWAGTLVGVYVNERATEYNLIDAIFCKTDDGVIALSTVRDPAGRPFDFQVVHNNQAAARLLGVEEGSLLWQRLGNADHLLCSEEVMERLGAAVANEFGDQFELEYGDQSLRLRLSAFGDIVSVVISDVTSFKRRDASFRLLFDSNPMPMWALDAETMDFVRVNDAAVQHYGYARETFLRMKVQEIWPDDERVSYTRALREAGDISQSEHPWRHVRADGTEISALTFGRRLMIEGREGYLVVVVDITERRKVEARIAHMALHDGLTNLANRALHQRWLGEALESANAAGNRVAALCIDLDLFKNVNDSFGHLIGDHLLEQVADRLRSRVAGNNLVARLGGDEFSIILTDDTSPTHVSQFAGDLIRTLSAPYEIDDNEVIIGASVGIALSPGDGAISAELMRNADIALYRAKEDGRGTHRFFEREMDQQVQRRREMELDLRRAFASSEFELYYQPLVEIASDKISGFEALLRWPHPGKGMISPAEFIPLAEEIGLIGPLGEWVLREACKEAVKWPLEIKVAVNLSPVQFRSRNLVQVVISALANSGLAPKRLELEITESVFLAETEANLAILHQLRELGVSISLDDFGTGYSSLSYLRSFPFDKIKIDRSFVKDLAKRSDCGAIVRAISGLGRSLNITTTAEGVETTEQLDWLRAEGCNEVQGFLFSGARPAAEVGQLLFRFGAKASRAA
ncbi:diguanylate cyclase (GGDEF)-like protein/PAS domain S-box-containing protein [Bradyrhizobium sp. cir1]|uniref:putative bifunctional diguanylate cyclase/phosphodiesterase n=1 Tax=Bradyrhizobium sp. cir1 TaxID=1445730 RepID=UPI001606CA36|nr:EAL domain-containing protein [Bradyrhizobium sp. cir1]MBB4371899.1 diguanylate cyclase (GGDEF)-like protein/PAS domain S-box-containing protein [Bradyrhizobium sp. cir1]